MLIRAELDNRKDSHRVTVTTNGHSQALTIPPKPTGLGSNVNGGELLALAVATCFCNDLYREAAKGGITVHSVEVEVDAEFGGPGDPARALRYRVRVSADASDEVIHALISQTDRVSEVHNTLRSGIAVELDR